MKKNYFTKLTQICSLIWLIALAPPALRAQCVDGCEDISSLPCSETMVSLPYQLDFDGNAIGLQDQSGVPTGFTMVQSHSAPRLPEDGAPTCPVIRGYEASRLLVNQGVLEIEAAKGIAYTKPPYSSNNNTQVNTLGVGVAVDNRKFSLETTILNINTGGGFAQAGLWFGADEDNFVKLVAVNDRTIELRVEKKGFSLDSSLISMSGLSFPNKDIHLRLVIDNLDGAQRVSAFYRIAGQTEAFLGSLPLPAAILEGLTLDAGNTLSFGGLMTTYRNGSPYTVRFDDFRILDLNPEIPNENQENEIVRVNFSNQATTPPAGWVKDFGQGYAQRTSQDQGQGFSYGWVTAANPEIPLNLTNQGRNRIPDAEDVVNATMMHMSNGIEKGAWEIALPNGSYEVTATVGDPDRYVDSEHQLRAEGIVLVPLFTPEPGQLVTGTNTVSVQDGKLTLDAPAGINAKIVSVVIEPVEETPPPPPSGTAWKYQINFQTPNTNTPEGYLADTGQGFGQRGSQDGESLTYGWIDPSNNSPYNNEGFTREREVEPRELHTYAHMQKPLPNIYWEIDLPNGLYDVKIASGDNLFFDSHHIIRAEGVEIMNFNALQAQQFGFKEAEGRVEVKDGRLTLQPEGGINTKISYIWVNPVDSVGTPPPPPPPPTNTAWKYQINFQTPNTNTPDDYLADTGQGFGNRGSQDGESLTYGWLDPSNNNPYNNEGFTREREVEPKELHTYMHMQKPLPNIYWEIALPNGFYEVKIASGDNLFFDSHHIVFAEGVEIMNFNALQAQQFGFKEAEGIVEVKDGRLTLKPEGGINTKISYVWVNPIDTVVPPPPPPPPAGSDAKLAIENLDQFPAQDELTFSRIQNPWNGFDGTGAYNGNHDLVTLRLRNTGTADLVIDQLKISNNNHWKINSLNGQNYNASNNLPLTIAPNQSRDLLIEFIAMDVPDARDDFVKVLHGTLEIHSNDTDQPVAVAKLHGLWQRFGEAHREPTAQEIIDAFGFQTKTGFGLRKHGSDSTLTGNEVRAKLFEAANPNQAVYIRHLASYQGCCNTGATIRYEADNPYRQKGGIAAATSIGIDTQTLLPRSNQNASNGIFGAPVEANIVPGKPFTLTIGGDCTNFNLNYPTGTFPNQIGYIGVRVWEVIDSEGNKVPNAYLIANDYLGSQFTNYDYNDNVYYVSNVKIFDPAPSQSRATASTTEMETLPKSLEAEEAKIEIFPNPFDQKLEIRSQAAWMQEGAVKLELYDSYRNLVLEAQGNQEELQDFLNQKNAQLKSGIYVLRLYNGSQSHTIKVIKR